MVKNKVMEHIQKTWMVEMTDKKKEGYEVSITGKVFVSDRDLLEQKYAELKAQAEKMKCCENSTTTLDGAFISCCLQEEVIAKDEVIENLEKENAELNRDKTELVNSVTELKAKVTELEKEIDYYKSRESHWDEIEEDAKIIAEENAGLKSQIRLVESVSDANAGLVQRLMCCGNCKHNSKIKMYKNPCRQCFELSCWEAAE